LRKALISAGGAVARGELTATAIGNSISDSNMHFGWTVGVGVEKAFTPDAIGRLDRVQQVRPGGTDCFLGCVSRDLGPLTHIVDLSLGEQLSQFAFLASGAFSALQVPPWHRGRGDLLRLRANASGESCCCGLEAG